MLINAIVTLEGVVAQQDGVDIIVGPEELRAVDVWRTVSLECAGIKVFIPFSSKVMMTKVFFMKAWLLSMVSTTLLRSVTVYGMFVSWASFLRLGV